MTKCYWYMTVGTEDGNPDLWPNVEVKWSPRGNLLIPAKARPERLYFLVTGQLPAFRVEGWLRYDEAAQPRYWREDIPKPAWIVPRSDLRPPPAL